MPTANSGWFCLLRFTCCQVWFTDSVSWTSICLPILGKPWCRSSCSMVSPDLAIPARAEKPFSPGAAASTERVYPRPRGEAHRRAGRHGSGRGLSPPTWGSPPPHHHSQLPVGCIPAPAPVAPLPPQVSPRSVTFSMARSVTFSMAIDTLNRSQGQRVYPRPCGGAGLVVLPMKLNAGLSPSVRGSHGFRSHLSLPHRSIPARAGEPGRARRCASACRVYPRPCQGAPSFQRTIHHNSGLSPPVRGSLGPDGAGRVREGSIPARAGEPLPRGSTDLNNRVYPRPCGGALASRVATALKAGLSPPVRGSPRSAG